MWKAPKGIFSILACINVGVSDFYQWSSYDKPSRKMCAFADDTTVSSTRESQAAVQKMLNEDKQQVGFISSKIPWYLLRWDIKVTQPYWKHMQETLHGCESIMALPTLTFSQCHGI